MAGGLEIMPKLLSMAGRLGEATAEVVGKRSTIGRLFVGATRFGASRAIRTGLRPFAHRRVHARA